MNRFVEAAKTLLKPQAAAPSEQPLVWHVNNTMNAFGGWGSISIEKALQSPSYLRVLTLITGIVSVLITKTMYVVDSDNEKVNNRSANRILTLLRESPDGEVPAQTWHENMMLDYLARGNNIALVMKSAGRIVSIRRLIVSSAEIDETQHGIIYSADIANVETTQNVKAAAMDIIHTRWPMLDIGRFAPSPLSLLRTPLNISLQGDGYTLNYFTKPGSHRATLSITFEKNLTPAQTKQITDAILDPNRDPDTPIVLGFGAKVSTLNQRPDQINPNALREFQVKEISRVYGVPAPLVNEEVTQWGQGISELAKMFWRFSGRLHIERYLAALSMRLLPAGQRFEIDELDIVRGSPVDLSQLITAGLGDMQRPQVMTIEEARRILGLPKQPDGELIDARQTLMQETDDGGTNDTDGEQR